MRRTTEISAARRTEVRRSHARAGDVRLGWHRPLPFVAFGVVAAMLAALVWVAAFLTPIGERLDRAVLNAFINAGESPIRPRIQTVEFLADLQPFLVIGLVITVLALIRRRLLVAALVPVILFAANATTQALQVLAPRVAERGDIELAWPSGHATAAMSLALCAVLVASPRLRPAAAGLGAGYAVAVGYAKVALGDHLPSDVIAGYLVAATFALLGAAALTGLRGSRPKEAARTRRGAVAIAAPAIGALVVLAIAAVAVLAKHPDAGDFTRHAAGLAAGVGIAALGVALIAGLTSALRA